MLHCGVLARLVVVHSFHINAIKTVNHGFDFDYLVH